MSEQINAPMLPPPSGVSEWLSVWRDALTKPSDQTFAAMAQSPNAKLTTALLWVFLGSLVNTLLGSLVQGAIFRQMMQNSDFGRNGFPGMAGGGLVGVICGAPIAAVISVVIFAAVVGVVQLIAKMFGGRGTFDQQRIHPVSCHPIRSILCWSHKPSFICLCGGSPGNGGERCPSIRLGASRSFLALAVLCSLLLLNCWCDRHPARVGTGNQ